MPAQEDVARRLRDLHDEYVWEVNAAVGEGRADLVQSLVDDFLDEALRMTIGAYGDACERPGCVVCAGGLSAARPVRRRPRWWRLSSRR